MHSMWSVCHDGSLRGGAGVSSIYRQWAQSSVMVLIFVLYSNWMKPVNCHLFICILCICSTCFNKSSGQQRCSVVPFFCVLVNEGESWFKEVFIFNCHTWLSWPDLACVYFALFLSAHRCLSKSAVNVMWHRRKNACLATGENKYSWQSYERMHQVKR